MSDHNDGVEVSGFWALRLLNADGSLAWEGRAKNGVTNVGLNYLGGVGFSNSTQIGAWYAGLISQVGFTSLSSSDTMATHPGWTEFTAYTGVRPQWTNSTSGQQTSSSGSFAFAITANGNIQGIFIVGGAGATTVGGTLGTLWSTAQISPVVQVSIGQTLTGTYMIQFSGG